MFLLDLHQDLTGIEQCIHLTEIRLGLNPITDTSPIGKITHLRGLGSSNIQITDVSHYVNFKNMVNLGIGDNPLSDVSPLGEIVMLEKLFIYETEVCDISFIENLTNLKLLILHTNQISESEPS